MSSWWRAFAQSQWLRTKVPAPLRGLFRRLPAYQRYALERMRADLDARALRERRVAPAPRTDVVLGIIKEFSHLHLDFVNACLEMGVPYKLIDIAHDRWIEEVRESGCRAFLVRPSDGNSVWKRMYDDRLWIMVHRMGAVIYPTYEELWIYESKRRTCDWLKANEVPHPRTAVFYDMDRALRHLDEVAYPIIYKSDIGSGALGVRVLRSRSQARRHVRRCFHRGYRARNADPRDCQWGYVLFQEFLPDVVEWRVVRLGDSYFAHEKVKHGLFHSGTGLAVWRDPPRALLDFVRRVTDRGPFTSMNVDVFECPDGRYLVNEMQAMFGWIAPSQMYIDGRPCRYCYDEDAGGWVLEEGVFCQNGGANLRVEALLRMLGIGLAPAVETHR